MSGIRVVGVLAECGAPASRGVIHAPGDATSAGCHRIGPAQVTVKQNRPESRCARRRSRPRRAATSGTLGDPQLLGELAERRVVRVLAGVDHARPAAKSRSPGVDVLGRAYADARRPGRRDRAPTTAGGGVAQVLRRPHQPSAAALAHGADPWSSYSATQLVHGPITGASAATDPDRRGSAARQTRLPDRPRERMGRQ